MKDRKARRRNHRRIQFETLERRDLLAAIQTVPYFEDFNSLPDWEYNSTNDGQTDVVGGRLRMDGKVEDSYSLNEAILHLDLDGQSDLWLTGDHWQISDELHSQDGIFISEDGNAWHDVSQFDEDISGSLWIDLDAAIVDAGINYSPDFQIKFSQYDNYPADYDGREWDNISIDVGAPAFDVAFMTQKRADIEAAVDRYNFTGTVIADQYDQTLYLGSDGSKDDSDQYNIASVTKHFTSVGILLLEEQGELSVNDKFSDHVPGGHSSGHRFTLHQLMTHTSGICRDSYSMCYTPGSTHAYSNTGYRLLRDVIDEKTGSAKQFVQTEILDKAGMTHSHTNSYIGSTNIFTTADDMAAWHQALRDNIVLTPASYAKLTTPYVSGYGYGLYVTTYSGHAQQSHSGLYNNYRTRFYRFPDDDATFTIMTTSSTPTGLISDLRSILIKEPPAPVIPPTPQAVPYLQTFDTKPNHEAGWGYSSTNEGRIIVTSGQLRMDDESGNSTYSQNEAVLHLDLSGVTGNLELSGSHTQYSDEEHSGDGIFVSNNGVNWTKVDTFSLDSGNFTVNLNALGVAFTDNYRIKFSQYDNYPASSDGRSWDNIRIEEVVPPTPQTLPYVQDFASLPGRSEGWEYASTGNGRIEVVAGRLRMDDTTSGGYSLNEATLYVDLQGATNVHLTGQHWDLSDEEHDQDGIFVSADGVNWQRFEVSQGSFDIRLPDGTTIIKFSQYDNYPASTDGREYDGLRIEAVLPPTPQVVTLGQPYVQTFDTKPGFAEGWEYASTNQGRIEVVAGRLRMDDSVDGGNYSLNEAILHVDLQGSYDAHLSGFHVDISDEEHDQDGIFVSSDGVTWTQIFISAGNFEVLIPDGTTMIKFSQYDNYAADTDGREWDNLRIELFDHTQPIDWPAELGFYKDMFIDGGYELSSSGTNAAKFLGLSYQTLFTSSASYQNSIMVSSATDSNGALLYPDGQPRFRLYYMNGGSSGDHVASLGAAGKQRVQDFFHNGGSYSGSCAGAFAAGSRYNRYYQLIPNTNFDSAGPWGTSVDARFTAPEDKPFADVMDRLGVDKTVYNIAFYGGPIYKPGIDSIVGTDIVQGLQYFGTNFGGPSSLNGHPQVAAYKGPGTGQMAILAGHPEYASSGSRLGLTAAVYQYALDGARKIPDLKADLSLGQTVQMVGPTQMVGDNQYHRFTVDVPAGADSLDVSLSGLSGNADVFVQCDSPANAQSYLAKGTQTGTTGESVQVDVSQACSVLHVSVLGVHDVKNGTAYSLTVA